MVDGRESDIAPQVDGNTAAFFTYSIFSDDLEVGNVERGFVI